ncbi:hypothetical protein [Bogoriella caseilytica]|uniref:Thiosulfate dehydrogenase [quinone] large subunit n=1 Tax=Bogoriella caseilytica TaxID=56055 RepID=A0A3N2B9M5_9MICO|nr:hypothetical protein [Bogoriella caseilytica]ROR71966.1 thiosulfate dehydrogenase [quinone] large subunit [Bogoriella caseilytica]
MTTTKASLPPVSSSHDRPRTVAQRDAGGYAIAVVRIMLGWYFLWAFIDKTFGFGFATPAENAWIRGGSPTTGYLSNVEGPFGGLFNSMAGITVFDWLFQLGLLGIGVTMLLGIGVRVGAAAGAAMLFFMYLAALPIATNPIFDDHLMLAGVMVIMGLTAAGGVLGFGKRWAELDLVKKQRWLI